MENKINGFGGMIVFLSYLECINNSIGLGRFAIIFKGPIKMIERTIIFNVQQNRVGCRFYFIFLLWQVNGIVGFIDLNFFS